MGISPPIRFVLASASPRRVELLRTIGLEAEVIPSRVEEHCEPEWTAAERVERLGMQKARDVHQRLTAQNGGSRFLLLAADTLVALEGRVLGKPASEEEAAEMLQMLSGRWHEVYTSVVLAFQDGERCHWQCQHQMARVKMRELAPEEIWAYVSTGEPMDKAGSYGIQEKGALLVEKVDGDYFTVVGLPLSTMALMLKRWGFTLF